MTYATLMVHLELGRPERRLAARRRRDMAARFEARVIGIAACRPMQMYYAEGYGGNLIEQDRDELTAEIATAEAEFRLAVQSTVTRVEWRSTAACDRVVDFLAREARAADLVLTGVASRATCSTRRAP